jgi:Flp pilus assembly protein TadD
MDEQRIQADTITRLEEAEQLKLMGRHREALCILETLVVEDPENVAAIEEISDNELSLEEYRRAEVAGKRAVTLDDESYTGHYILGFIYSHKEEWPKALSHLRKANTLKPNNPEILRCLGWALFNAEERAQGIVTLERALNLDDENSLTLCDLGVAYLQVRNFAKSKRLFERAIELDGNNIRAQECLQAIEKLEEAVKQS